MFDPGSNGDGGPAVLASVGLPQGLALDSAGNLFISVAVGNRVRRVDAVTGIHHVFAGATVGEIVRGSYDPAAPGRIAWDSSAELPARESRIHSIEEVEGVLYAGVGSDEDTA